MMGINSTRMKFLSAFALIIISYGVSAQYSNFNSQRNWSLNKKEVLFAGGASQFLGDLGGKDQVGTDYRLTDLDWPATSFAFMFGFRYRFHPYWSTTTCLNLARVKGSDAFTNEQFRRNRNLSFKAPIYELSQRLECIILANEKVGKRYNIPGLKGLKDHNDQMYLFSGVGVAAFVPKAKYNGKYYKLRPLKTEGQGLPGGIEPYKPVTLTIPFGVGARIGISRMWRLGIEATYVKTFTDYIDDVSGVYFNPNQLYSQVSPISAALANRTDDGIIGYEAGQQRGDIQKDAYFYLNVVLYRNITYKNYSRSMRKIRFSKGRYKF
jgi:hypothetical protein